MVFLCIALSSTGEACINSFIKIYSAMDTTHTKEEQQKVAKAILELHDLYISTGEEKKPMTISLPDLSEMAGLSQEATERILTHFIEEKFIRIEKSAIIILNKRKLKKIAG
jgi:CRP-like cAMP-binding protein